MKNCSAVAYKVFGPANSDHAGSIGGCSLSEIFVQRKKYQCIKSLMKRKRNRKKKEKCYFM